MVLQDSCSPLRRNQQQQQQQQQQPQQAMMLQKSNTKLPARAARVVAAAAAGNQQQQRELAAAGPQVHNPAVAAAAAGEDDPAAAAAPPPEGPSVAAATKPKGLAKQLPAAAAAPSNQQRGKKGSGKGAAAAAAAAGGEGADRKWYQLPAVEITDEVKRDLRLLRLRGAYDPKRFYKSFDDTKFPKHFAIGTVVDDAQDFYGGRLSAGQRKATLTEQLLADPELQHTRKKRYGRLQEEAQKWVKHKKRKTSQPRKTPSKHRPKH
ncbi:hypothetical protein OEZ85_007011 [Tetradesmus obliquus]|uniref:Fcf2 pre-rRNA processing C-terminal domain-containing protein n=1 Tax=Tetradesmus obliquus TaxID=3088 RepID=A0ABY8TYV8_TETOB|nr:hypothetical protein OEZ85_007011 [Tetradesmus obliquus]